MRSKITWPTNNQSKVSLRQTNINWNYESFYSERNVKREKNIFILIKIQIIMLNNNNNNNFIKIFFFAVLLRPKRFSVYFNDFKFPAKSFLCSFPVQIFPWPPLKVENLPFLEWSQRKGNFILNGIITCNRWFFFFLLTWEG